MDSNDTLKVWEGQTKRLMDYKHTLSTEILSLKKAEDYFLC